MAKTELLQTMGKARPLLTTLEEIFGFAISDQDARRSSTPALMAECLAAWFSRLGDPEPVLIASSFVRLRRVLADEFSLPRALFRPVTPWEGILSRFPAAFCRRKWKAMRKSFNGLPRLTGPSWPWILLDLTSIPFAPLLYSAVGGGIRGIAWALGLLLFVSLASLSISRILANKAPHQTLGESAKCIAEARREHSPVDDPLWMTKEIGFVLHEVLEVELEGRPFTDETPFQTMELELHLQPDV